MIVPACHCSALRSISAVLRAKERKGSVAASSDVMRRRRGWKLDQSDSGSLGRGAPLVLLSSALCPAS